MRYSLMSLEKKEETFKPEGPSLSLLFQKAQFTLFCMVSPVSDFESHTDTLLPQAQLLMTLHSVPIHQFCYAVLERHLSRDPNEGNTFFDLPGQKHAGRNRTESGT